MSKSGSDVIHATNTGVLPIANRAASNSAAVSFELTEKMLLTTLRCSWPGVASHRHIHVRETLFASGSRWRNKNLLTQSLEADQCLGQNDECYRSDDQRFYAMNRICSTKRHEICWIAEIQWKRWLRFSVAGSVTSKKIYTEQMLVSVSMNILGLS